MPRPGRHRPLAAALASLAVACADGAAPPYTRLDDAAPPVARLPPGPTLVVFWATWCPPCREEAPGLRALARAAPGKLRVVTFGEDADEADVRSFFGGPPPPELGYRHDAGGRIASAFGVEVLPAAFLSVDGRLRARFDGPREWDGRATRRLLARLASEAPPAAAGRRPAPR